MVRIVRPLALFAFLSTGFAAEAQPLPPGYWRGPPRFAPYYYRFRRFGPYGYRRGFPRWLSYGTGYRGRGTATGGPSGGLPNRN